MSLADVVAHFATRGGGGQALLDPLVKEAAAKYAKEKNITPRKCEG